MEQIKKRISLLKRVKWICLLLGFVMFISTNAAFGFGWAMSLSTAAAVGFYLICDGEVRRTICQYVADDLKDAVASAGHKKCVVEIKSLRGGLITRVYLIGAGARAGICGKAVINRIKRSWYKNSVWVTQLVDLEDESELETAQEMLNEELLSDFKKMKERKSGEGVMIEKEEELRQWVRAMMEQEMQKTAKEEKVQPAGEEREKQEASGADEEQEKTASKDK